MKRDVIAFACTLAICAAGAVPLAAAGPVEDLLATYATAAKAADPGFSAFSASQGESFFMAQHQGGKPDTPSCTSCHTQNVKKPGQTRAGKAIEPMALSANPGRFSDAAKAEKWFGRNCNTVLGRDCTAVEKGNIITWLASQ